MMWRTWDSVVEMRNWARTRTWETTALMVLAGEEGEKRESMETCGNVEQEPGIVAAAETRGGSGTVVGETQSRESRRKGLPEAISVPDLISVMACLSARLRTELGWCLQCL